ncbi:MAG: YfhO family protein [Candidatus Promineofilum sp.]|nr:YfhO family protein [Promineifilum sp.]
MSAPRAAAAQGQSRPIVSWLGIPLLLIGLIALFFNKMAFSNLILARGDTFLYFYPYWQAAADALRSGRVPLWNPDIFMGVPFLANSQTGFFYPLNWPLWLLLPTPYAVNASILIHVAIAGIGTYLAGRRTLALGRWAALFAAVLFALGGYLTGQVEHINQLQGLAWLPWFFAVLSPLVTAGRSTPTWRETASSIVAVAVLLALQLLAGHTQTAFISGMAVALWLLVHLLRGADRSRAFRRMAVVLGAGVALAALLAAVQLLPTLELAGQSSRQGGLPLNDVLSFSWNPLHLTRAWLPAYGQTLFTEYVAFLPLTALALAVVGAWVWRKNPAVAAWVIVAGLTLVLALGRFTPVYYLLGRLPGFDLFRAPARWLAVASLAIALLAGYGWERLRLFAAADSETAGSREPASRVFGQPLAVAGCGLLLLIVWGYAAGWLARWLPPGTEAPFELPALRTLLGWAIEAALGVFLFRAILTAPPSRAQRGLFDLMTLVVAVLWLGSRGLPYDRLTTPEAYFDLRPPQARLAALATCAVPERPCASPPDRFLSLSDIFFDPGDLAEIEGMYAEQLEPAAVYDYVVAVKHKEVLSPNLSMVTGLPAIDGFDGGVLPLRAYSELMRLVLPAGSETTDGRLREYLDAAPDSRWLSLFNGRYLITDKTGDLWREGVFFDRQHPVNVTEAAVAIADVSRFEATELWMLAAGSPPPVEIKSETGEIQRLTPVLHVAPNLYRVLYPGPLVAAISLLPCPAEAADCGVEGLTLVDSRDGTFQPLALPPYRLIFSGDVKIYENLDAQPRAFMVYDWHTVEDMAAAVAVMETADFEPQRMGVVIGGEEPHPSPASRTGSVKILDYQPESVSLHVATDTAGLLVLTDAFYPGWEATVNGDPAPVQQVDGLFRGVFLPAGEHEIVLSFRPNSFRRGTLLSALGIGLIIGIAVWSRSKRWRAGRRAS